MRAVSERKAHQRLEAAIFAGGLLGLLGGLGAALLFSASIARRIQHLEEQARLVAAGQPILDEIAGNDEIALLGHTLKRTSQVLTRQSEQLRAAHGALESRVEQRTAELSQAIEDLREANEVRQAVIRPLRWPSGPSI